MLCKGVGGSLTLGWSRCYAHSNLQQEMFVWAHLLGLFTTEVRPLTREGQSHPQVCIYMYVYIYMHMYI
jgi:hypothetical protein